ncbi:MAG: TonB family protein [Verrucomicrobiota bacterium]
MNAEPQPPAAGWSTKRWLFFIALALAAHAAFVFLFGAQSGPVPRPVTRVPEFHLVDGNQELVALTDPTLFALPHLNDFHPAAWLRPVPVKSPTFHWSEPPHFLPPVIENLGAAFSAFMQTNYFGGMNLDFKPEPASAGPAENFEPARRQDSTLKLTGQLAERRMLNEITVPTLKWNDVLKPSRVQALVDTDGKVASVVLSESSESAAADQQALNLARTARFAPAASLMFGELIFNWHTVPAKAP